MSLDNWGLKCYEHRSNMTFSGVLQRFSGSDVKKVIILYNFYVYKYKFSLRIELCLFIISKHFDSYHHYKLIAFVHELSDFILSSIASVKVRHQES